MNQNPTPTPHPFDPHHPPACTVLVAGAAGFVGSHLCDRLLEAGCEVIALDDLSTGDMDHVGHLRGHPNFHFLRHDITQPLPDAAQRVQRIYNLACPASPAYYQRHPVRTVLTSALGTWRLLELAQANRARLLQVSTSEVYGDPQVHPQHEGYWGHVNPIGPRACYDEGKRCAESMCYAYAAERGVEVRVARLFNCYGPRLHPGDGRVVSNFVTQALTGRPLTIYGNGLQTRSFCYVEDTVDALLRLMDAATHQPVNIGNPNECTMVELAERVLRLTGSRSRLAWRPLPADDPLRRKPDISRAAYELGWEPRIGLDEGLLRTIAYFRRWAAHAPQEARHRRALVYSPGLAAPSPSAAYSFNRL
jgi:UDP-glucuronate decarboxylase